MNENIIKQLRDEHKITQETLASEIGVDRSIISRWETGKSVPTEEQAQLLSNYFQRPVEDFLMEEPDNSTRVIDKKTIHQEILLIALLILSVIITPYTLPLNIYCIYFSIKRKLPWQFVVLSLLVAYYCVAGLLFIFGIYITPSFTSVTG